LIAAQKYTERAASKKRGEPPRKDSRTPELAKLGSWLLFILLLLLSSILIIRVERGIVAIVIRVILHLGGAAHLAVNGRQVKILKSLSHLLVASRVAVLLVEV